MSQNTFLPSIVADYERKTAMIARHQVSVISYRLGERYVCGIDNIDPGATICRATGNTRRAAQEKALQDAVNQLTKHRYLSVSESAEACAELEKLVLTGEPEETYAVMDFLKLPLSDRMAHILSGRIQYFGPTGEQIPSGDAMRLLKKASESLQAAA
jgi:hypothetical protein